MDAVLKILIQFVSFLHERPINMNVKNTTRSSKTDWDRLAAMSDEDIDYSDIPPLEKNFFKHARIRLPRQKVKIDLEMDADLLARIIHEFRHNVSKSLKIKKIGK